MKLKLFILSIAVVLLIPECSMKAPKLDIFPVSKAPAPISSTFFLTVNLNNATLYDRLEAAIPKVYTGKGHGNTGGALAIDYDTQYEIQREQIKLGLSENAIDLATTLSGWGNAVAPAKALRPRISVTMDVAADIGIQSKVELNPDWSISSATTTRLNVSKASTKILKIPVSAIDDVQEALYPKMDDLAKKVTQALNAMDVRTPVEKAWKNLAKPILVDKKKSGWLTIKPRALYYSGFKNTDSGIKAVIGVDAIIDGAYGSKPKAIDVGELPPFQVVSPETSGFNINLPVFASYQYLRDPLKREVVGKVFDMGEGAVMAVRDANIHGNGERIVVTLTIIAKLPNQWLNTSGKIYFSGKPIFDEKNNRFSMLGFDYVLETGSFLVDAANAVFYESLREKIAKKLSWDLTAQLQGAKLKANQNLANVDLRNGAILKGSVTTVGVNGIYPLSKGIQIGAVLKGDVSVEY